MIHNQGILSSTPRPFVPPRVGEVIEFEGIKFFIGEEIDQGEFGKVFGCRDEWGNDLVAKVILPRNRPHEVVRRECLHEFQTLQHLRHPQITFIHKAFEYQNTFYLIIEKCAYTLKALVPNIDGEGWLPYISRDILNGLHYIHDCGYVHKDLHAGNIFVSQQRVTMNSDEGLVWKFKIGDLGISRLEGDIRLFGTILAQWMKPPEYLCPKEFGPMGKHVDIYHVGLLLLSLLLNQTPNFTDADIIAGRPRKMAEGLPSKYAPAIERALRRHVHVRTPSAIEMWRDISLASER